MFTGIIETLGKVTHIEREEKNVHFGIKSNISNELHINQSVAHNGVCLTVTRTEGDIHWVTAIDETLNKSNLGAWKEGTVVNLERCMKLGDRLDGHIVQGHVDQTATLIKCASTGGSWRFTFEHHAPEKRHLLVEKGSICINGTSLTLVDVADTEFSVAIIPYTYKNTNFHALQEGDRINLEFDIIGKYVERLYAVNK